jgi:hypothetical protein
MEVVRIMGGLSAEPMHATAGTVHLVRTPGEALEAFEARAVAAGQASGAGLVVIGGLPEIEDAGGAEAEADALAESIISVAEPEPDPHDCAGFAALVAFADRTGLFTPSPRHLAALALLRGVAEAGG